MQTILALGYRTIICDPQPNKIFDTIEKKCVNEIQPKGMFWIYTHKTTTSIKLKTLCARKRNESTGIDRWTYTDMPSGNDGQPAVTLSK